jgi:hypothetical protein
VSFRQGSRGERIHDYPTTATRVRPVVGRVKLVGKSSCKFGRSGQRGRGDPGLPSGRVIRWKVPAGLRRLRIEEVTYQPEDARAPRP